MNRTRLTLAIPVALVAALTTVPSVPAQAAATWLPATTISGADAVAAKPAVVAADGAGNVTAVWETQLGGVLQIRSATHAPGGAWSDPVTISSLLTSSTVPSVDVDASGRVTAVWLANASGFYSVASATRATNGTWGGPVPVGTASSESVPRLGVSDDGHATAVWQFTDELVQIVVGAQRTPDGTWEAPRNISQSLPRNASNPDVDVHRASSQATVVWDADDGAHRVVQMSFRGPGNPSWSAPLDLSDASQNATQAHVAIADIGQVTIAWTRFDGSKSRVQALWNYDDGIWGGVTTLSAAGEDAFDVRVAVDPAGEATVVWRRQNGSVFVVQSSSHVLEGPWSPVAPLSDPTYTAMYPNVAAGPGGTVATWYSQTGAWETRAARRAGGAWGPSELLGGDVDPFYLPGVGVDGQGDAVVTWAEPGGVPVRVRARALDVAGPALTAFQAPATGTAGKALSFSASAIDTWSSVATYGWKFGDGKSASGPSVKHKYGKAGSFRATLTVTDTLGNVTTRVQTVKVKAPRPVIKALSLTDDTIHKGEKTKLKIKLNTKAKVTVVLKGKHHGVKAVLRKKLPKGKSQITLTTTVGGKVLVPDTYVVKVTAKNGTGTSKAKSVVLRVLR